MAWVRVASCVGLSILFPAAAVLAQEPPPEGESQPVVVDRELPPAEVQAAPATPVPVPTPTPPETPAKVATVEPPVAVPELAPRPRWSFAVGVGMSSFADNLRDLLLVLDAPAVVLATANRPEMQLMVERHGKKNASFLLQLGADYARDASGNTSDSAWSAAASLGVRNVVNPGGTVEVSPFAVTGFSYAGLSQAVDRSYYDGPYDGVERGSAWTVGAGFGFCLDRKLIDALYLRFSTLILRAAYTTAEGDRVDATGRIYGGSESSSITAGFALRPSLQLRLEL